MLHLPPTINKFQLQVSIPMKGTTLQYLDELIYHQITVRAGVVACLNGMGYTMFRVSLPIKLLELWRLVATGHAECINPLGVRLGVEVSSTRSSSKLFLHYNGN